MTDILHDRQDQVGNNYHLDLFFYGYINLYLYSEVYLEMLCSSWPQTLRLKYHLRFIFTVLLCRLCMGTVFMALTISYCKFHWQFLFPLTVRFSWVYLLSCAPLVHSSDLRIQHSLSWKSISVASHFFGEKR